MSIARLLETMQTSFRKRPSAAELFVLPIGNHRGVMLKVFT